MSLQWQCITTKVKMNIPVWDDCGWDLGSCPCGVLVFVVELVLFVSITTTAVVGTVSLLAGTVAACVTGAGGAVAVVPLLLSFVLPAAVLEGCCWLFAWFEDKFMCAY